MSRYHKRVPAYPKLCVGFDDVEKSAVASQRPYWCSSTCRQKASAQAQNAALPFRFADINNSDSAYSPSLPNTPISMSRPFTGSCLFAA
jgi:hypothetical protein